MKPNFALSFNHDAISLLMRAKGGWRSLGEAALDDPELADRLRILRASAVEMSGSQFASKLVIPNSQLLYRDILAPGDTPGARRVAIRQALDGATPYQLEDLVFDWSDAGNGMTKVAVVAHVTLEEAEEFAVEHRFNPVSFVAIPQEGDFTGEPCFGMTRLARGMLTNGEALERDDEAIKVIGSAMAVAATDGAATEAGDDDQAGLADTLAELDEDDLAVIVASDDAAADADETAADDPDDTADGDEEADLPEIAAIAQSVLKKPDPHSAVASMAFSTRRLAATPSAPEPKPDADTSTETPAASGEVAATADPAPPLLLDTIAPRIAILPAATGDAEPDTPPDLAPPARMAEVTHLSVNAADVVEDDRKPEKPVAKMPPPPLAPVLPPKSAPMPKLNGALRAAPVTTTPRPEPVAPAPKAAHRAKSAELGVFGSRKADPPRRRSRYLGLVLTLALILALAAAALISNLILGDGSFVSRLFAPQTETAELRADTVIANEPILEDEPLLAPDGLAEPEIAAPVPVTPEVAAAMHAETGIWPLAPVAPIDPDDESLDDLYIASIDPVVIGHDAIALPAQDQALTDNQVGPVRTPVPAGAAAEAEAAAQPDRLAGFRPRARPTGLVERNERSRLGGRTLSQLAALRPAPRPDSAQDQAIEAPPTKFAVLTSRMPQSRPSGFAAIVNKALAEAQAQPPEPAEDNTVVASAAVAPPKLPSVPTRASVAEEATIKNALNLREINLIGVYGSSSNRRALIRLSSGKYIKVQVGDRIDGGQVAAISADQLLYVKGGRKVTLSMPNG